MLTILSILSLTIATAHGCVRGLPDASYLASMTEGTRLTDTNYTATPSTHYVFTSVVFECYGAITGWTLLALDGSARGRPEISIWRPTSPAGYIKRGGHLVDDCSSMEEVVEGTEVYLHHGYVIKKLLHFQPGDVLGMLSRLNSSSDFSPLLVRADDTTGFYNYPRNGPYIDDTDTLPSGSSPTINSPLLSLELCVDSNDSYPNCSDIELPENPCKASSLTTPSPSPPPPSTSPPSSPPPSSPHPSPSSSSLPTWVLIASIAVPCVVFLLVIVVVLAICLVCCMHAERRDKVDISPHQVHLAHSSVPTLTYDTPDGDATHTYETPLERRPPVTISLDGTGSNGAIFSGPMIANHTRTGSHAAASVYEEPVLSVPQYDSILGAQHLYDDLMSSDPVHPPSFSRHNSPHLLITPPPYTSTAPIYHTLERPLLLSNPPSPHNRHTRPVASPLVRGSSHSRGASCDSGDGTEQQGGRFRPHFDSSTSQDSNQLSPSYQIIRTDSTTRLNSGIYVPTQQQRSQPIFDDNIYAGLRNDPDSPLAHNWSFFVETDHYWKPASDKVQLYDQLHAKKYREINRKQIQITSHLGAGEFGTVCKGFWHTNSGSLEVAIKMVQNQTSEADKVRFLQEAAILGQFRHANIVQLHGVVTVSDPVLIVLELMKKGDLKNYLETLRPVPGELVQPELQYKLLTFCSDVAMGMEYLARKDFIHRDIAARNILLAEDCTCKIADFGMSRDLDDEDYYLSNGGKIPFKWTAPEALHYRKYSTASDVWSYGILLWEIWSLGHTPYSDCQTPDEATALINSGTRLPPPPGCPRTIYKLMMECWSPKPSSRPSFTSLLKVLHEPSTKLLHWTDEDSRTHIQATCLGASMEAGHNLYPDLQIMYSKASV